MSASERQLVLSQIPPLTASSDNSAAIEGNANNHSTTPFAQLIDTIFATIAAIVLAWRFLLYSDGEEDARRITMSAGQETRMTDDDLRMPDDDPRMTDDYRYQPQSSSSMDSLRALLPTDTLPDDCRQRFGQGHQWPYMQGHSERYLIAIPELEEESDDCLSSKSSSVTVTVCERIQQQESLSDPDSISELSRSSLSTNNTAPDSSALEEHTCDSSNLPSPTTSPSLCSSSDRGNLPPPPPPPAAASFDYPNLRLIDSDSNSSSPDLHHPANNHHISTSSQLLLLQVRPCKRFMTDAASKQADQSKTIGTSIGSKNLVEQMADCDCDRNEIVINRPLHTISPCEDSSSLNSTSISINHSNESLLDFSICSNPINEAAVMEQDIVRNSSNSGAATKDDNAWTVAATTRMTRSGDRHDNDRMHLRHSPPQLPPLSLSSSFSLDSATRSPPLASAEDFSSDLQQQQTTGSSQSSSTASTVTRQTPVSIVNTPDHCKQQQQAAAATIKRFVMRTEMESPPSEPPPPPPPLSFTSSIGRTPSPAVKQRTGTGFDRSSVADLMSRSEIDGRRSSESRARSGAVRDVPVQRMVTSSMPSNTSTVVDYRTSTSPWGDYHQEEYYRKEVRTRTYLTHSTETLSAPPLSSSSPIEREREREQQHQSQDNDWHRVPHDDERTHRTYDINYKYIRNVEEEERRIQMDQEQRRREEEKRRRRAEEERRQWELHERELLENKQRQLDIKHRELESERLEREKMEKQRLDRNRLEREQAEMQRRNQWEKIERARLEQEEMQLQKWRDMERRRFEQARLEEERKERERLERERVERERERVQRELAEKERMEREHMERERIETERLEIERIERIKRERDDRDRMEREREKQDKERLEKERLEKERIAREKEQLLRMEDELIEAQRREARLREEERIAEENREARRRDQERKDAAMITELQKKAEEREAQRRMSERLEAERLESLRREQQRLEQEKQEAECRERERLDDEQREKELLEAQKQAAEKRERERLEDEKREKARQEEERREAEKRERERLDALRRERERQIEEELERQRLAAIENAAQERKAARLAEIRLEQQRSNLEREANELKERKLLEAERRERERLEEERRLQELHEQERRHAEQRERERQDALKREAERQRDDRRSRDKLDHIAREIEEKEKMEREKLRLLTQMTNKERRKDMLTSRETLEKLTKAPYYSRENLAGPYDSRENVGEVTTKVERQVIERVDRTVWSDDPARSGGFDGSSDPNGIIRERLYSRKPDDDDLSRSSSRRTSRYRSKLEKARREFLSGDGDTTAHDGLDDRFRQSSADAAQRSRPEYRGPLLQRFHDGEFSSKPELSQTPYTSVGPSPYDQVEETNLDDVHRSRSVMDYDRYSRRDAPESVTTHIRSKSADYLMDRRMREESAPPENELQKFGDQRTPNISEHELRFRKSTEKLHVPEWYRERRTMRATDLDNSYNSTSERMPPYSQRTYTGGVQYSPTMSTGFPTHDATRYSVPFSYETGRPMNSQQSRPGAPVIPYGMFDKYKNEIQEMRRSRSSLHQIGAGDERKEPEDPFTANDRSSSYERTSMMEKVVSSSSTSGRQLPGYTVTPVPTTWNIPGDRHSRVVEVADTFAGSHDNSNKPVGVSTMRYDGRVTVEEVLDTIFQRTRPSATGYDTHTADHEIVGDDRLHQKRGIYSKNRELMQRVMNDPTEADTLLQNERLYVCCSSCFKSRELSEARIRYISCKYCYTYYCSRECREHDWPLHKDICSFARINTLCKEVIIKVRGDAEAQWFMSRIARDGYTTLGRGSVNLRLGSAHAAQSYVTDGWRTLADVQLSKLLHYYTVAALLAEHKEPSLIALCRKYDPNDKFILSVSIIADMEHCPQTPPPEPVTVAHQQGNSSSNSMIPQQAANRNIVYTAPDYAGFTPADDFGSAVPTEV